MQLSTFFIGNYDHDTASEIYAFTHKEDSIKHGILHCPSGGTISITASKDKNELLLSVEDKGIGREKAAGGSNSTGKGLKLTNEIYDILNQINKKPIRFKITDLPDTDGIGAGTKVDDCVPVE